MKFSFIAIKEIVKANDIQLDNNLAPAYTIMADIYAAAGMLEDAEKVEAMRMNTTTPSNHGASMWLHNASWNFRSLQWKKLSKQMIYTTKTIKTSKEKYITMACVFVNACQLVNTEVEFILYEFPFYGQQYLWFKKTSIQFQSK